MSKLLTPAEAAAKLNVSLRWIRTAIFEQRFPTVRLGRLVRVEEDVLDAFIESNRKPVNDKGRAFARPASSRLVSPSNQPPAARSRSA